MKRAKDGSPRSKRPRMGQGVRLVLVTCVLLVACVIVDAAVQTDEIPLVGADMQAEQETLLEQAAPEPQQTGQNAADDGSFFAAQRMEKEKVRAQEIELLQELAAAETTTAEARTQAEAEVMRIAEDMETELVLEGLLAGKYGGEASVFIRPDRVDVILAPTLKEIETTEAERIAELVNSHTGMGFENTVVTVR